MSQPSPHTPADEPFDASVFEDRAPSVGHLLRHRIADTPESIAYSFPAGIAWDELTWEQLGDKVWAL
ncbi:MAG: long-chain fatty acid--CoA ligase, partial [Janibacter sp.]